MSGLEIEIRNSKNLKHTCKNNLTFITIAKILECTSQNARAKVLANRFTTEEAFKVFDKICTMEQKKDFEYFKYLFSEQKI